jgi:signal transduction histidine kinase
MMQTGERWDRRSVTIVNLVDLGANVSREGETNTPTIVLPKRDTNAPPREDERFRPRFDQGTNEMSGSNVPASVLDFGAPPREPGRFEPRFDPLSPGGGGNAGADPQGTNTADRGGPRPRGGPTRFGRPFWMNEKEFQALVEKRGLHGFVIVMSTAAFLKASDQDLWLRCVVAGFAGISVLGLGLAWRNIGKSSELQMRLLRASELNTHLKEMNLAAAGLAHETRNPLNIIRGLAQMISKQQDASTEVRRKTREIIDETDRVTAQLNEFINYSRPREVRRTAVPLKTVVNEVARALTYDLEEKCVRLRFPDELPVIEADEQLLRQALFNLLINAVQAVERGGDIEVAAWRQNSGGAVLEIRDNGPGVDPAQRTEIFKPYFTTQQKGTGLGLAVVEQIVLAHGWEIECIPNEPRGAIFRIAHLKLAAKA